MEKTNLFSILKKSEIESLPIFYKNINFVKLDYIQNQKDNSLIIDKYYTPRKNEKYMTDIRYIGGSNTLISKIYSFDKIAK